MKIKIQSASSFKLQFYQITVWLFHCYKLLVQNQKISMPQEMGKLEPNVQHYILGVQRYFPSFVLQFFSLAEVKKQGKFHRTQKFDPTLLLCIVDLQLTALLQVPTVDDYRFYAKLHFVGQLINSYNKVVSHRISKIFEFLDQFFARLQCWKKCFEFTKPTGDTFLRPKLRKTLI